MARYPNDGIDRVELDPAAADTIADAVIERMKGIATVERVGPFGNPIPNRSILEPGGIKAKPGESAVFYGGDDMYSDVGSTDAEIATNLYLASVVLETPNPKTGRPFGDPNTGGPSVSERMRHVMVGAATKALQGPGTDIPDYATDGNGYTKAIDVDRFVLKGYRALRREAGTKAMTSTGANAGDEWVPTFATAELWRDVHLQTEVAANIQRVAMTTNPYTLPTLDDDMEFKLASTENTAVTASDPDTGNATLTAVKVQAEVDFSGEFTEDSIVPAIPSLRATLVRRGAQTIDDLIVHSDTETGGTGNVNSDNGAPAADSFYLAFNGLRKFAVVTNSGQTSNVAAALTNTNFTTIRALLGKYGARASDLRIVTGVSTFLTMGSIAEVLTLEKYGPNATILRGELARFQNIPILLSEAIPGTSWDKIAADGKSDTTVGTTGWLVLFNVNAWRSGFRREFQIESWRDIKKDQNVLVASFRMALIPSGISTIHTATGRNVTV